jgi:DNA polymerase III delta subunit
MITLLLGPDDFSKIQYAESLAAKEKAELEVFVAPQSLPSNLLSGSDLFGGKKTFVVKEGIKTLSEQNLPALLASTNSILFFEEKLDKRVKFNKDLLANKSVTVKEFPLPHGRELNTWLVSHAKALGGNLPLNSAESLAIRLGRDEAKETKFGGKIVDVTEVYSLWQADSELRKLIAYAGGEAITLEAVALLVSENKEADVLDIVNAIGEKNKERTLGLIHTFLQDQTASDEKGKIIQLNALLSEQFRNVALVQDFTARHAPEAEILQQTEWKSGRLFVMKKIASHFNPPKVLELLGKLGALDEELKTSQTPPQVLLDLIIVQLLA